MLGQFQGLFYPADAQQLANGIQQLLMDAGRHELTPKALIVPHAGYLYSGAIAATAYATCNTKDRKSGR